MDDTFYDSQILEAMEHFHHVWSRVSMQPSSHIETDSLFDLISTLCTLQRNYTALISCFPRHKTPRLMAQETAQHCRWLLAEYYLREGCLPTRESTSLPQGKRPLLRSVILLEKKLSDLLKDQHDPSLRETMTTASNARTAAAKELLISSF